MSESEVWNEIEFIHRDIMIIRGDISSLKYEYENLQTQINTLQQTLDKHLKGPGVIVAPTEQTGIVRPGGTPSRTQPAPIPRTRASPTRNIPSTTRNQSAPINKSASLWTNTQAPRPGYTAPSRIVTRSNPGGTPSKTQPTPIPRTITSPTRNVPSTTRVQPTPVVKPAPPQTTVQTPVQSIKKPLIRKK